VAERREELFDLLPVAGGTSDFFVSKDEELKFLVALHTMIFKYWHSVISCENNLSYKQYKPI
jgi:hypothetical protein